MIGLTWMGSSLVLTVSQHHFYLFNAASYSMVLGYFSLHFFNGAGHRTLLGYAKLPPNLSQSLSSEAPDKINGQISRFFEYTPS
jgi:hypothetical protein